MLAISRNELYFLIISFIIIFTFVNVPVLYGYLTEPADMAFTGRTLGIHSFYSYLEWMIQAREGHLLFTSVRFHYEPMPSLYINLYFLVIGALSGILGIEFMGIYFVFYAVSAFLLITIVYILVSMFSEDRGFRKVSFIISLTSTGFGILLWSFIRSTNSVFFSESATFTQRIFPIDLWLTDAFPLLTMHTYSLHTISLFFMIGVFILFIRGWEKGCSKTIFCSAILTLVLGAIHPYDIVTVYAVTFIFAALDVLFIGRNRAKKLKMYLLFLLVSSPIAVFTAYTFLFHPIYSQITPTNFQVSPNPYSYIIGGGIPFILALFYLLRKVIPEYKEVSKPVLFVSVWAIANYILAYSPMVIQRKVILGMQIPLAILASLAIFEYILPRVRENMKTVVVVALILLMLPTGVFFIAKETYKVGLHEEPYYINRSDAEAIEWIMLNTDSKGLVMAGLLAGEPLSGRGHMILAGHWEAINYSQKKGDLEIFFTSDDDGERINILGKYNAKYVYYGHEEQNMSAIDPESLDFLVKVFENSRVKVFEVKK